MPSKISKYLTLFRFSMALVLLISATLGAPVYAQEEADEAANTVYFPVIVNGSSSSEVAAGEQPATEEVIGVIAEVIPEEEVAEVQASATCPTVALLGPNAIIDSCSYMGKNLRYKNLSGSLIVNSTFNDPPGTAITNMQDTVMSGVEVDGTSFNGTSLLRSNWSMATIKANSDFRNAKMNTAILNNASFEGAFLDKANWTGVLGINVGIKEGTANGLIARGANLTGISFENTSLIGAAFNTTAAGVATNASGAHIIGALMNNANLTRINLSNANLEGVTLDGANLTRANLNGSYVSGSAIGANLTSAILGASWSADLDNAILNGATGASYMGGSATGASFVGANFSGRGWSEGSFDNANFSSANFNGASLSGTANGASLLNANFSNASWYGVSLIDADLSGANLSDASLGGADITGAIFSSATVLDGLNAQPSSAMPVNWADVSAIGAVLAPNFSAGLSAVGTDFTGASLTFGYTSAGPTNLQNATLSGGTFRGLPSPITLTGAKVDTPFNPIAPIFTTIAGDLSAINFQTVGVPARNLEGTLLTYTGLAAVTGANFNCVNMKGGGIIAGSEGIGLINANARGTDFSFALFEGDFTGVDFSNGTAATPAACPGVVTNLTCAVAEAFVATPSGTRAAKFTGADMRGISLGTLSPEPLPPVAERTNLAGANLTGVNLSPYLCDPELATLQRANLRGVILTAANLTNANLSNADLRSANLNGANVTGVNATGVVYNTSTVCPNGLTYGSGGNCP